MARSGAPRHTGDIVSEKSVAQRAAEIVERSQRALARGDVEGYVACFTPDAELSDPGVPPMKGHAGIRQGVSTPPLSRSCGGCYHRGRVGR